MYNYIDIYYIATYIDRYYIAIQIDIRQYWIDR